MQLKNFTLALLLIIASLLPTTIKAQQMEALPIDSAVKIGTLPNGLTYIIRHNAEPKGRAHYYIAQKVGSILEEENQLGLAHFLEHMAFNGTKNFPGKNLISFLERIGCRFGADLNAYTAFDETVYTIMDAPTNQGKEIVDSCILILHDWSNNITLDHGEIDEERGVIQEEWRSRNNAGIRSITTLLPKILPNNKYANRMPIGTMDVVMNFPYQAIKDFYHKWYRPDLQGIIIVGDIDVDYVESKIKEYFADVKKPVNAAERYYVQVENNDTPISALVTDKENTSTNVTVMYKQDVLPREIKGSIVGLIYNYSNHVVNAVIEERMQAITKKPNAPFMMGGAATFGYASGICKTKDAFSFIAIAQDGKSEEALKALATEIKRLKEHGILKSEYERAKRNIVKSYQDAYNERNKRSNSAYIEEYKEYFLNGGYIPGIETEKVLIEQVSEYINVEQVNEYLQSRITGDKNLVVTIIGPEKDGINYPKESEIANIYLETYNKPTTANEEERSSENLIDKEIKPGKIVSEKKGTKFGATELKLSNGVTVYLLPTDYKEDEIQMSAVANGGIFKYLNSDKDILNSKILNSVASLGGLGKFDELSLQKALTGRSASASLSINGSTTEFSGYSTKEDFETMLQLVYLTFTDVRRDAEAYQAFKEKQVSMLEMAQRNPMASLGDSIIALKYDYSTFLRPLKVKDFDVISYDRSLEMLKSFLSSADGFQFFFVGNIDIDAVKPLIAKYLGSLPKGKATPKMDLKKLSPKSKMGSKAVQFSKEADTPLSISYSSFIAPMPYTFKNRVVSDIANGVLDQVLIASIREREGGTYSPNAAIQMSEFPVNMASIEVFFQADPDKVEHLTKVVAEELDNLVKNGVDTKMVEKTITNREKTYQESQRKNSYWLSHLYKYHYKKEDNQAQYLKVLKSVTAKDVQDMIKTIMTAKNHRQLIFNMRPKAEEKK